jgi:hypothetical protein
MTPIPLPTTIALTGLNGFHFPAFLAMHFPFLADFNALPLIPLVAIVGGFAVAVLVPLAAMYFQHQKRQLWHETARVALEKGQPLPAMPMSDEELKHAAPPPGTEPAAWEQARQIQQRRNDLRSGLILIAVGAGLYLFLGQMAGPVRYCGAIPGFIGVAMLLNALLSLVFGGKKNP